jgi:nucleoside-diphosphate-sugar epimerase
LLNALPSSWQVIGATRSPAPAEASFEWIQVEDEDDGLAEAVARRRPDLVIHAAFVNRKSRDQSDEDYLRRLLATNLLLFERCAALAVPVLLVSSSAVYGTSNEDALLDEAAPLQPVSLYGLAKTQQELLASYSARAKGLSLCMARLFNLVGPGRGTGTVVHDWIQQVAAIAAGGEPVLRVYNRATSRDLVDVRDAARALALLAERLTPGRTYNIATGQAVSLLELSRHIETLCPVKYRTVETDPRPSAGDATFQSGDAAKLRRAYGWRPRIGWRESVKDVWESYRNR